MYVLGIDPGLATTGWGVLENDAGSVSLVECGYISTAAREPAALRLAKIHDALNGIVKKHAPKVAAVEELFFTKNAASIFALGQARGVILLTLHLLGLKIYEYNPRTIKIALTGFGGAEKAQMQEMVKVLLKLDKVPRPDDVADALAAGLCHIHSGNLKERLESVL